tara:strand:- start:513 stop:659 length:147 start_codon:yes stop_codon:yes gene_type:complete
VEVVVLGKQVNPLLEAVVEVLVVIEKVKYLMTLIQPLPQLALQGVMQV